MNVLRSTILWTSLVLIVLGSLHSYYRHAQHQVPWLPGTEHVLWDVEARIEFTAADAKTPVTVRLALPSDQPGFILRSENTASPGYGLIFRDDEQRVAEWTARIAQGPQSLYYRAQFQVDENRRIEAIAEPPEIQAVIWPSSVQTAASAILDAAWKQSADSFSLARALVKMLRDLDDQNVALLLSETPASDAMTKLLNQAKVPARVLYGLELEDGRRRQPLSPLVQVFDGKQWQIFDPIEDDDSKSQQPLLLWQLAGGSVLEVEGGHDSKVTFSMLRTLEPASNTQHGPAISDALLSLSIHSLPISEQAVFRTLLLIPLAALIVVMLRVLVGLETSGTFMPVLIALAFLEMSLLPGILTFLLIVSLGLILRQLLAHMNLLLVARVSAVIVLVIGLIALFSVLSFHLGITDGMKITLFPMIILAWTIERMSIVWEEEGPRNVLVQGFGSLATAVVAYFVMDMPWVRYWMFNFMGLQLIVLAFILIFGSYTGYRLLELKRFKPLVDPPHV